ncbi:MAG: hypothetical protein ACREQX_03935 [Candidatus Binataceae bacterium]
MRNNWRISACVVAALIFGGLGISDNYAAAQGKTSSGHGAMANGKNPMVGMVFCDKMQTAELCPRGTSNTLKLSGKTAVRWQAEVHQYNKAIEAANQRLLTQARNILPPQQYRQIAEWFAKGLNPPMNQLLVTQGRLGK